MFLLRERALVRVKQEPTAWKVFYRCRPGSGCCDETIAGRIPVGDADSLDDIYVRAESMGQNLRL